MALERIGLGGVLDFDDSQATRAMGRARDEFGRYATATGGATQAQNVFATSAGRARDAAGRFAAGAGQATAATDKWSLSLGNLARQSQTAFQGIGAGLGKIGGALRSAAVAALPMTAGLAVAGSKAVSFEHQMSAVSAITRANTEDFGKLNMKAKELGAATVFTATQAGEAMENMGRSGATTQEIIGGISGVMSAASAESIDLATSADLVAQATRIMGREWSQASNTADVLALASAKSNTDMISLGEALKYGGQAAHNAGLSFEETVGILGKLADSGMRGSVGGTGLTAALDKLSNPSAKATEYLNQLHIKMTETKDGGINFIDIADQLGKKMKEIKSPFMRTAIATEIFGKRGARAFQSLSTAGEFSTNELIEQLQRASDGEGAAAEASKRRLDNVAGAWTLFESALEGASLGFFESFLKPLKGFINEASNAINSITQALAVVFSDEKDIEKRFDALSKLWEGGGAAIIEVAYGVRDAIQTIQDIMQAVHQTVVDVFGLFGDMGGDSVRELTRLAIVFAVIAGAAAPVGLALAGIAYVITAVVIPAVSGVATIIGAAFSPVLLVVGGLVAAFMILRRDGETVGQTLTRIWEGVKLAAAGVWMVINQIWTGIQSVVIPGMRRIGAVWDETVTVIKKVITDLANQWASMTSDAAVDWETVGTIVGAVLMTIAETILTVFEYGVIVIGSVVSAVMTLVDVWLSFLIPVLGEVWISANNIWDALTQIFSGDMLTGLKNLASAIFNFVLIPLKSVLSQIIALADAVGGGGLVPDAVRNFALERAEIGGKTKDNEGGAFDMLVGDANPKAKIAQESSAKKEFNSLGKEVLAKRAEREAAGLNVNVDVKNEPAKVDVTSKVEVDGRTLSLSSEKHKKEIGERAGFKTTPWQRRSRVEHGATPAKGG